MLNSKSPALRCISLVGAMGTRRDAAPHTCGGDGVVLGRGVSAPGGQEGKVDVSPREIRQGMLTALGHRQLGSEETVPNR